MEKLVTSSFRLGILGGGQLGKMLALQAANWNLSVNCLDNSPNAPARSISKDLQKGDVTCYEDVVRFGKSVDLITVESDNVDVNALEYLENIGKIVSPRASTLRIIQDKGLQRQFCEEHHIPIPKYKVYENKEELIHDPSITFPCIIKTRKEGYDGKGVFLLEEPSEFSQLPNTPLLYEEMVSISKELAVIVVRNKKGEIATYPLIQLFMKPSAYVVDYLISPAAIEKELVVKAQNISKKLAEALKVEGVLAVELFLTDSGEILVNECSPRPHNSGHHTIEASITSQYENHLRGICNLPLGNCDSTIDAAMINLLGDPNTPKGPIKYENLKDILEISGAKLHIYGKEIVSPFRKMGHITILNKDRNQLLKDVISIKDKVRVTS